MIDYILRNVDPELWHRVKTRALDEGATSVRAVILRLLRLYVAGKAWKSWRDQEDA